MVDAAPYTGHPDDGRLARLATGNLSTTRTVQDLLGVLETNK